MATKRAIMFIANNMPVSQLTNGKIVAPTFAPTVKNNIVAIIMPTKITIPSNPLPIDFSVSI
jgi:hypothetical protein